MPGTVPRAFDPSLVVSASDSSPSAPKATVSDSASKSTSDPSSTSSLLTATPSGHPTSGVAPSGVAQLIATSSATAALAPTNSPAKMTAKAGSAASSPAAASKSAKKRAGSSSKKEQDKKDQELLKFIETEGHFSLVRNFHLADAFTLMNGFCGAQSLFASARYLITSDPKHAWTALWFPLFGAIFDLLDGKVARWRKSSSMLGQELDSLADSLSFGAAPAFAAYALGLRLPLDTLVLTMFVCAGIARLARFNVTAASIPHDASGKARYFEGLPIPSSLVLVGGMAICLLAGRVEPGGLPIALARERGALASEGLTFTGALRDVIPGATLGRGVPGGTFGFDASKTVTAWLSALGFSNKKLVASVAAYANFEIHKISLLWAAWSIAMVSKTLRVPKP